MNDHQQQTLLKTLVFGFFVMAFYQVIKFLFRPVATPQRFFRKKPALPDGMGLADDQALRTAETEIVYQLPLVKTLHDIVDTTVQTKKSESKLPWSTSTIGISYEFSSFIRHAGLSKESKELIAQLKLASDNDTAMRNAGEILKRGSLWNNDFSDKHAFGNFFGVVCRRSNISIYKNILYRSHGIAFIPDFAYTLFRRDSRNVNLIFDEGFRLKPSNVNAASTRKVQFSEAVTGESGISFSKLIPPECYGNPNGFFEICLPRKHNLLLIDICESPKNKNQLTQERLDLKEVNSCDDIPREYIRGLHYKNNMNVMFFKTNPNFDPSFKVVSLPGKGCF